MNPSITISEDKIENQILEKITISGAVNHDEALEAVTEWCETHNCILVSEELQTMAMELENTSAVFFAKVSSDDYD
ncbi:MAG: hypothetical protein M3R50_06530 [Bacteroidota bacterium]|nr:hypothetical protein [Bacteroidota bacterium]